MTFVDALQIGFSVTFLVVIVVIVAIAGFINGLLIVSKRVRREAVDYPPEYRHDSPSHEYGRRERVAAQ